LPTIRELSELDTTNAFGRLTRFLSALDVDLLFQSALERDIIQMLPVP